MERSADLVPILAAPRQRALALQQGIALAWNTTTGANTIGVGSLGVTNMPIIGGGNLATITAGDQVMVLTDGTSYYVLGKLIKP
jgi:hypothetical protein